MSDPEVQPLTGPPTILATSRLVTRIRPIHAATAALSSAKQLDRQLAHAQMRVLYRKRLPLTQYVFYQQRQKLS